MATTTAAAGSTNGHQPSMSQPSPASMIAADEQLTSAATLNADALHLISTKAYDEAFNTLKHAEERLTALALPQHSPQLHAALALLATTYSNVAIVYNSVGHHNKALLYCQRALALERQAVPSSSGNNNNSNLSTDSATSSSTPTAPTTSTHGSAPTHLNMCAILSTLGRHTTALTHAEVAVRQLKQQLAQLTPGVKKNITISTDDSSSADTAGVRQHMYELLAAAYHNVGVQQQYLTKQQAAKKAFDKAKLYAEKSNGVGGTPSAAGNDDKKENKPNPLAKLINHDLESVEHELDRDAYTTGKPYVKKKSAPAPMLTTAGIDLNAVTKTAAVKQAQAAARKHAQLVARQARESRAHFAQTTALQNQRVGGGARSTRGSVIGQHSHDQLSAYSQSHHQRTRSNASEQYDYIRTLSNDGTDTQSAFIQSVLRTKQQPNEGEMVDYLGQYLNLDVVPLSNLRLTSPTRTTRAKQRGIGSYDSDANTTSSSTTGQNQPTSNIPHHHPTDIDVGADNPTAFPNSADVASPTSVYYLRQGDSYPFPSLTDSLAPG